MSSLFTLNSLLAGVINDREDGLGLFERRDEIDPGGMIGSLPEHLHRALVADLGGVGTDSLEGREQLVGHNNPRHLVVQPQG